MSSKNRKARFYRSEELCSLYSIFKKSCFWSVLQYLLLVWGYIAEIHLGISLGIPKNGREWSTSASLTWGFYIVSILFRGVTLLRVDRKTKAYWTKSMPLNFYIAPHTISSSPYSNHSPITQIFYIICITKYNSQEGVWKINAARIRVVDMCACQICVNVHVCACLFSLSSSPKDTKTS